MPEEKLDAESDFLVKQSKTVNFVIGTIMLAVFLVTMLFGDYGWSNYLFALGMFLIPGAIAIAKGRQNATIMMINKKGFYYAGQFVTNWDLFYDAKVWDKKKVGSYKDNFILVLRYYSADHRMLLTRHIPLINTQDKADEEIIEAIKFYYEANRLGESKQSIKSTLE